MCARRHPSRATSNLARLSFQSLTKFHIPDAAYVIREDPDGIAIYSDRHVEGIKSSFQHDRGEEES